MRRAKTNIWASHSVHSCGDTHKHAATLPAVLHSFKQIPSITRLEVNRVFSVGGEEEEEGGPGGA